MAGQQTNANGVTSRHKPIAVVLDFMQPTRGRMVTAGGRKTGLYEGGGTLQHAES
jgi:hypothetical protein